MPQARFRKFPARPHGWPDMMIRPQGVEPDLTPPEVDQAPPEGAGDEPHPEFHFTERSTLKMVRVEVAAGNPQIANLYAPGPIGTTQVHATADADLGDGVKTVTAVSTITVISGQAVEGDITFSQTPAQGGPPETATKAAPQSPKPSAEEGGEKSGEKPSKTPHRQSGV